MSQIDEELQIAKYRNGVSKELQDFEDNYYEPYRERGIDFTTAFMLDRLRDIYAVNKQMLEVLEEIYPDGDND